MNTTNATQTAHYGEVSSMMSPRTQLREGLKAQARNLTKAKFELRSISGVIQLEKFDNYVKALNPIVVVKPEPISCLNMLSPTSRPGATITLPDGTVATVTRVSVGSARSAGPSTLRATGARDDSVESVDDMPGNTLPAHKKELSPSSYLALSPTSRLGATVVLSNGRHPALSPTSRLGATVVLPNGKTGVVSRVEVSEPIPMVALSSTRVGQFSDATGVQSPTSRIGATIMLPNGRTAVVTRVEENSWVGNPASSPERRSEAAARVSQIRSPRRKLNEVLAKYARKATPGPTTPHGYALVMSGKCSATSPRR